MKMRPRVIRKWAIVFGKFALLEMGGESYWIGRRIIEKGPYQLLRASPCCAGPSRW